MSTRAFNDTNPMDGYNDAAKLLDMAIAFAASEVRNGNLTRDDVRFYPELDRIALGNIAFYAKNEEVAARAQSIFSEISPECRRVLFDIQLPKSTEGDIALSY